MIAHIPIDFIPLYDAVEAFTSIDLASLIYPRSDVTDIIDAHIIKKLYAF